ncbi:MAG: NAD(P)H-dependent oxidoreductase [Bacteroidota bacterium]
MDENIKYRIAVIIGSKRKNSKTRIAAQLTISELKKHHEIGVDIVDPIELSLPFPGEQSISKDPQKIQKIVGEASGIIIATPEYHGTYSAVLKLIIENLGYPSKISGKPIGLIGVASGEIGAIKSIESLRGVLAHVGGIILPGSASIPKIEEQFNGKGECINPKIEKRIRSVSKNLIGFIRERNCPDVALEEIVREDK